MVISVLGGLSSTISTISTIRMTTTVMLISAVLGGCRDQTPPPPAIPTAAPSPAAETEHADGWVQLGASPAVAVPEDMQVVMRDAIARARATAGAARTRWAEEDEADRARWAIKWAAPTRAGGIEYVWVRPVRWTRHRIEGHLAGAPRAALDNGRGVGELVGFPEEELADWLRDPEPGGVRDGGFTVEAIEFRFGHPPGTSVAAPSP